METTLATLDATLHFHIGKENIHEIRFKEQEEKIRRIEEDNHLLKERIITLEQNVSR
ncbi:MAG: hypothetical protein AAF587_12330 [Bacteroidota bacterium]